MAIKPQHSDIFSTNFIAFTCSDWLSLFEITGSYDLVYNWFHLLKEKHNANIIAYVTMPNHRYLKAYSTSGFRNGFF